MASLVFKDHGFLFCRFPHFFNFYSRNLLRCFDILKLDSQLTSYNEYFTLTKKIRKCRLIFLFGIWTIFVTENNNNVYNQDAGTMNVGYQETFDF